MRDALSIVVLLAIAWTAAAAGTNRFQVPSTRPNAFWCPMHPDIRSPDPGKCPLCSMELMRIPAPTRGAYELDATQIPRVSGKGTKALRIQIRHPETGLPVTAFSEIHERALHLFIIGRDLSFFAHVHPEKTDSGFELPVDLPSGAYVLVADFVPGNRRTATGSAGHRHAGIRVVTVHHGRCEARSYGQARRRCSHQSRRRSQTSA